MGDIVVKCPLTLKTVPTGLESGVGLVLDSLPPVANPLRCPRAVKSTSGGETMRGFVNSLKRAPLPSDSGGSP